jgi:pimeloyl-ACP methyl ester carboxylesterase
MRTIRSSSRYTPGKANTLAKRAFDFNPTLRDIKAPPLIITGELDVFAPLSDAKNVARGVGPLDACSCSRSGALVNF